MDKNDLASVKLLVQALNSMPDVFGADVYISEYSFDDWPSRMKIAYSNKACFNFDLKHLSFKRLLILIACNMPDDGGDDVQQEEVDEKDALSLKYLSKALTFRPEIDRVEVIGNGIVVTNKDRTYYIDNAKLKSFGALLGFIGLDVLNGEKSYFELWNDGEAIEEGENEDE